MYVVTLGSTDKQAKHCRMVFLSPVLLVEGGGLGSSPHNNFQFGRIGAYVLLQKHVCFCHVDPGDPGTINLPERPEQDTVASLEGDITMIRAAEHPTD